MSLSSAIAHPRSWLLSWKLAAELAFEEMIALGAPWHRFQHEVEPSSRRGSRARGWAAETFLGSLALSGAWLIAAAAAPRLSARLSRRFCLRQGFERSSLGALALACRWLPSEPCLGSPGGSPQRRLFFASMTPDFFAREGALGHHVALRSICAHEMAHSLWPKEERRSVFERLCADRALSIPGLFALGSLSLSSLWLASFPLWAITLLSAASFAVLGARHALMAPPHDPRLAFEEEMFCDSLACLAPLTRDRFDPLEARRRLTFFRELRSRFPYAGFEQSQALLLDRLADQLRDPSPLDGDQAQRLAYSMARALV